VLILSSDFDNTMIVPNMAVKLVTHYLLHSKDSLFSRIGLALPLLNKWHRRKRLDALYEVYRRIPAPERRQVIAATPASKAWLKAVQDLRFEHKAAEARVNIISRNCIDVITPWIAEHREFLRQRHITIGTIVANRPLGDQKNEFITLELHHIDHAGFGRLNETGKKRFLGRKAIYIGDYEEEVLRGYVGQFVRV
jgi:hypothetical protein